MVPSVKMIDDNGAAGTGKGSARGYTREASQRAADDAVAKRGRFVVRTASRQDGQRLGTVIYTFTVESQKQGFLDGRWPLAAP